METKRCYMCNEVKPLDAFYRDRTRADDRETRCKECSKKRHKSRYDDAKHRNKMRSTALQWYQDKLADPASAEAIREKRRLYMREYRKRKAVQAREAAYQSGQQGKAKQAVRRAILQKRLPAITEQHCAECDSPAEEYHHWSYEEQHWLDVIPLCRRCHGLRHRTS